MEVQCTSRATVDRSPKAEKGVGKADGEDKPPSPKNKQGQPLATAT